MTATPFDYHGEISWCPGCGDYKILEALKLALTELELKPEDVVLVSGIGQAAKMPHYMKSHFFNGLHGRALPAAAGIKATNPNLTVIAVGGDGDMYGEGGNHFLHTIRRNSNITNIVCNNRVYGLTKGQASPTSTRGMKTANQPGGVKSEPMNPLAVALSCGATFVARGYAGEAELTKELFKRAILHKGYALVDVFQPCVSFNKLHTWQWYAENTYKLQEKEQEHERDLTDHVAAMHLAFEADPYPLGVIYEQKDLPPFEEGLPPWLHDDRPLYERAAPLKAVRDFIEHMV